MKPIDDRMKEYESASDYRLPIRVPKIIRIDGRAFHTVLRSARKPFDEMVSNAMASSALALMRDIGSTARFAYVQSDECSIAINDALTLTTSAWFSNRVQKVSSVAASMFTLLFNDATNHEFADEMPAFDARFFCVADQSEVMNYFRWRRQDCEKNSISSWATSMYTEPEVHGKNKSERHEMMFQKGFNWAKDAPEWTRNGMLVTRGWTVPCPEFSSELVDQLWNQVEEGYE